jgi:protein arginine kinase
MIRVSRKPIPVTGFTPPCWLTESGPENDVVLSTRCRIARNLAKEAFPWRAAEGQRKSAAEAILNAVHRAGGELAKARAIRGDDLTDEETARLMEWRYASLDWARGGMHRWLLVAPDSVTSLLVNEEDHLRLQTILPGLQVESVQKIAVKEMDALAAQIEFACEERIGWLTASPTNAGTGLRIGVLLHLAGLAMANALDAILDAAVEMGCAVRGLYGEGTSGTGELFQLSNTCAHGVDAEQIVERVAVAARYLVDAERDARRQQFGSRQNRARLKAAAAEALKRIFEEEAAPRCLLPLVSVLRLAIAEGVLKGDVARTSEWVALAGVDATRRDASDTVTERYEAVRRSAALRQKLRAYIRADGTFGSLAAD